MKSPLTRWVVIWTLLALGLRLGFVLAVERSSFVLNDSFFYGLTAKSLAEGDGFSFVGGSRRRNGHRASPRCCRCSSGSWARTSWRARCSTPSSGLSPCPSCFFWCGRCSELGRG